MIGLPMDFGAEIKGNAKYYQTCLAQVLRQINSATDMEDEFLASFNQSITNTTVTDQWMTSHITASSCLWDNHKEMIRRIGYDTIIDAESMQRVHGPKEFGHFQGYWDEGITVLCSWKLIFRWSGVFVELCGSYAVTDTPRAPISYLDVPSHTYMAST
jgi:hypothetical protein